MKAYSKQFGVPNVPSTRDFKSSQRLYDQEFNLEKNFSTGINNKKVGKDGSRNLGKLFGENMLFLDNCQTTNFFLDKSQDRGVPLTKHFYQTANYMDCFVRQKPVLCSANVQVVQILTTASRQCCGCGRIFKQQIPNNRTVHFQSKIILK